MGFALTVAAMPASPCVTVTSPLMNRKRSSSASGASHAPALRAALAEEAGRAHVVGVTGPPGCGKSTLVSALIKALRARGQTVAVVAVDPSSPFSGGAVLGDRVRMGEHQDDEGVFIRSLASRGHLGGLSVAARDVVDVFDVAGYHTVILETVGAGQSEVEITQVADTRLVVCPPGLGDDALPSVTVGGDLDRAAAHLGVGFAHDLVD